MQKVKSIKRNLSGRNRTWNHKGLLNLKQQVAVSILTGSDEVFGKEVVSRPERFYRIYEPFSRKGTVIKHFNTN